MNATTSPSPPATTPVLQAEITLDREPASYQPGETLGMTALIRPEITGEAVVHCQAAELSLVWYTTGKGEENLAVHAFQRHTIADRVLPCSLELTTTLPQSPLSYAGRIVKVCWAVRVRLFLPGGKQLLFESPLQLGTVAPAAIDEAAEEGTT